VNGPLQHEPARIRPPFDVVTDRDLADDQQIGEAVDQWRARRHADRVAALLEPLGGVELGAYDRRIVDWLAGWDTSVIGTVASLLHRAREAGPLVGSPPTSEETKHLTPDDSAVSYVDLDGDLR
jgi:hypothetical protein